MSAKAGHCQRGGTPKTSDRNVLSSPTQNTAYGKSRNCLNSNKAPRRFILGRSRMIAAQGRREARIRKANARTAHGKPIDTKSRLSMIGYRIPATQSQFNR